jgi:hypothetical protein
LLGVGISGLISARNRSVRVARPVLHVLLLAQVAIVLINGDVPMYNERMLAIYAPLLAILLSITIEGSMPRVGAGLLALGGLALLVFFPGGLLAVHAAVLGAAIEVLVWLQRRPALMPRPIGCAAIGLLLLGGTALMLRSSSWLSTPHLGLAPSRCATVERELGESLLPVMLPNDRVSPEAIGMIGYVLDNTYIHDPLGLTDAHVARHGDVYLPREGKTALSYTYEVMWPTVLIYLGYSLWPADVERASSGRYRDRYSTYQLAVSSQCTPDDTPLVIGLRNDAASRIIPALQRLTPIRETIPPYPRHYTTSARQLSD